MGQMSKEGKKTGRVFAAEPAKRHIEKQRTTDKKSHSGSQVLNQKLC